MIPSKRESGNISEFKALNFLEAKGFLLLERNFYIKGGELDLIMQDNEFIVFVEVKSLRSPNERDIYSTLSTQKKRRLKKTINQWLYKNNKLDSIWRFDFVGIYNIKAKEVIEHFEFVSLL